MITNAFTFTRVESKHFGPRRPPESVLHGHSCLVARGRLQTLQGVVHVPPGDSRLPDGCQRRVEADTPAVRGPALSRALVDGTSLLYWVLRNKVYTDKGRISEDVFKYLGIGTV